MRKKYFLLVLLLLALGFSGCSNTPRETVLLPLDSRPINTVDVVDFAKLANENVLLPDQTMLDDFQTPGDTTAQADWLLTTDADRYVIFTNQLFCGGLMASRNLDNYQNLDEGITWLKAFLTDHQEAKVTCVTVLPRLAPSEYDDILAPYTDALIRWNQGDDTVTLPQGVQERYQNLFTTNSRLVDALATYKEEGLIDEYIIALDDYEPKGLPIRTWEALKDRYGDALTFTKGADELTMMLLAKQNKGAEKPFQVAVHYTNPQMQTDTPLYEGQALATTVQEKIAFLGGEQVATGDHVLLVHNDPAQTEAVATFLEANPKAHVALADVSRTNQGDQALWQILQHPPENLSAYAGWNTAGNSIGTALAWLSLADTEVKAAQRTFWERRLAEDHLYLAHLKYPLAKKWQAEGFIDYRGRFTSPEAKAQAEKELNQNFDALWQTTDLQAGQLHYPWNRMFEVTFMPDSENKQRPTS